MTREYIPHLTGHALERLAERYGVSGAAEVKSVGLSIAEQLGRSEGVWIAKGNTALEDIWAVRIRQALGAYCGGVHTSTRAYGFASRSD